MDAAGGDDEPDAEEWVANRKPWGIHMVKGLSTWAVERSGPSFWERVEDGFHDLLGSLHGGGRHLALAWAEGREVLRRLGSSEALYRVRQFASGFGRQLGANVYLAGDPLGYASTFPGHDASHQDASYQAGQVTADLVSMALGGLEMLAGEGIAGAGVITTGAAAGVVVTLPLTPATVGGVVVGGAVAAHGVSTAAAGGAHLYTMAASASKGGTYMLVDPETGQVMRTGRSKNLDTRKGQHARDPAHKDLDFEVDRRTDDYAQQRGREQVIHDAYDPPLDKIEPISPTNPRRAEYLDAAKDVE